MLLEAGADAFLIGETIMKDGTPGKALKELLKGI
jgi:indole-3-glycerol phosphate synthase